ncbi:MAG: PilZ domain-containing protein [Cyanobacteria bacterium K_Offshore_surface_m2_011]|nr:PilZ domain-containing protein [Cyanobacteria bacterium K_Offshore_surface_m2_011]
MTPSMGGSACMAEQQTGGQPTGEPLTSEPLTGEPLTGGEEHEEQAAAELQELRTSLRHVLPGGVSASIRLSTGRTIYVTVGDVSRTGACVVRRGSLEVLADEEVLLDISDYEQHQSVSLPARVQWVNTRSYNTLVGLAFSDGPLLPGTMLDQYFDQTLQTRDGFEG